MTLQHLVKTLAESGQAWPDAPTLKYRLGRDWTRSERRTWLSLLEKTYGRQTLVAAWAIFGRDAVLDELARLQPHAPAWLARVGDGPYLAPLLAPLARVLDGPPPDLQALRCGLLRRGLQPAAWKWLCRQHRDVVRKLSVFGWSPETIFWVNMLSRVFAGQLVHPGWLEAGRPYMLGQLYSATQVCPTGGDAEEALQLERFLRLVPTCPDAQTLREYEVIAAGMLTSLYDDRWLLRLERGTTWKGLLERLRRYNDERLKQASTLTVAPGEHVQWEPRFGALTLHGVKVRELTCTLDLVKEGFVLTHCVGDGAYTEGCVNGRHVLASLEEPVSGMRATLQLVKQERGDRAWLIGQLAGVGNSRVPQFFWQAGRDLQQRLAA